MSRLSLNEAKRLIQAHMLARKARKWGVLPLLIEVVRIERGLRPGWWVVDRGRLWVCVE